MANNLEPKYVGRIATELARGAKFATIFQAIAILASVFFLDRWLLNVVLASIGVYWLWFGFVVFLRGRQPTHLDLSVAKWGYPALLVAVLCLTIIVMKLQSQAPNRSLPGAAAGTAIIAPIDFVSRA